MEMTVANDRFREPMTFHPRTGDILGYARVSTRDQDLSGKADRLIRHGVVRVFEDVISGKMFTRPGMAPALDQAHGIHLISLEERIDATSAAGELVFHVFGALARRWTTTASS